MSFKDINTSEKMLTIKYLFRVDSTLIKRSKFKRITKKRQRNLKMILRKYFRETVDRLSLMLVHNDVLDSSEVSDHIADYVAFKLQKFIFCPECQSVSENVSILVNTTLILMCFHGVG